MTSMLEIIREKINETESMDGRKLCVIVVSLPINKVKNINFYETDNNIGKAYLSNRTTQKDALEGLTRYGLTGVGSNCVLIDLSNFKEGLILDIENYLNNRFGDDWVASLKLIEV